MIFLSLAYIISYYIVSYIIRTSNTFIEHSRVSLRAFLIFLITTKYTISVSCRNACSFASLPSLHSRPLLLYVRVFDYIIIIQYLQRLNRIYFYNF